MNLSFLLCILDDLIETGPRPKLRMKGHLRIKSVRQIDELPPDTVAPPMVGRVGISDTHQID